MFMKSLLTLVCLPLLILTSSLQRTLVDISDPLKYIHTEEAN